MSRRIGAVHLGLNLLAVAAGGGEVPTRPLAVDGTFTPAAYLLADAAGRLRTPAMGDDDSGWEPAVADVRDILGCNEIRIADAVWPVEAVFRARLFNPLLAIGEHLGSTDLIALPYPQDWPEVKIDRYGELVAALDVEVELLPESVALAGYVRAIGAWEPGSGVTAVYCDGRSALVVAVQVDPDRPTESVDVPVPADALTEAAGADRFVYDVLAAARSVQAETTRIVLAGSVCFHDSVRLAFQNHLGHRLKIADHPLHAIALGAVDLLLAEDGPESVAGNSTPPSGPWEREATPSSRRAFGRDPGEDQPTPRPEPAPEQPLTRVNEIPELADMSPRPKSIAGAGSGPRPKARRGDGESSHEPVPRDAGESGRENAPGDAGERSPEHVLRGDGESSGDHARLGDGVGTYSGSPARRRLRLWWTVVGATVALLALMVGTALWRAPHALSPAAARDRVTAAMLPAVPLHGMPVVPAPPGAAGMMVRDNITVTTGSDITSLACASLPMTAAEAAGAKASATQAFALQGTSPTPQAGSASPQPPGPMAGDGVVLRATYFDPDSVDSALAAVLARVQDCPNRESDTLRYVVPVPSNGTDPGPPQQSGAPRPEGIPHLDTAGGRRLAWRGLLPAAQSPTGTGEQMTCLVEHRDDLVLRSCGMSADSRRADTLAESGLAALHTR